MRGRTVTRNLNDCGHQGIKVGVKSLKDTHKDEKYHWQSELDWEHPLKHSKYLMRPIALSSCIRTVAICLVSSMSLAES